MEQSLIDLFQRNLDTDGYLYRNSYGEMKTFYDSLTDEDMIDVFEQLFNERVLNRKHIIVPRSIRYTSGQRIMEDFLGWDRAYKGFRPQPRKYPSHVIRFDLYCDTITALWRGVPYTKSPMIQRKIAEAKHTDKYKEELKFHDFLRLILLTQI